MSEYPTCKHGWNHQMLPCAQCELEDTQAKDRAYMENLRTEILHLTENRRVWQQQATHAAAERDGARIEIESLRNQLARELRNKRTVAWTEDLPDESGLYWWWNEDEDSLPIVVDIFYSGTDGSYFAPAGQHGWTRFQPVAEMCGYWARITEPTPPDLNPED